MVAGADTGNGGVHNIYEPAEHDRIFIGGEKMITEKTRKRDFVRNISTVLAEDPRSGVEYIEYDGDFPGGREAVTIHYSRGTVARINVTDISSGEIYREIGAEVYGSGAAGRMRER